MNHPSETTTCPYCLTEMEEIAHESQTNGGQSYWLKCVSCHVVVHYIVYPPDEYYYEEVIA